VGRGVKTISRTLLDKLIERERRERKRRQIGHPRKKNNEFRKAKLPTHIGFLKPQGASESEGVAREILLTRGILGKIPKIDRKSKERGAEKRAGKRGRLRVNGKRQTRSTRKHQREKSSIRKTPKRQAGREENCSKKKR